MTLKVCYVYELVDLSIEPPKVFYVGKGTNNRIYNHAIKVQNKIENNEVLSDDKEIAIAEFLQGNKSPEDLGEIIIGRFDSDEEAFAVEATMIKWIYGRDSLTNQVAGHYSDFIRTKGDYDKEHDIQPKTGYSERQAEMMEQAGTKEIAENLVEELTELGFKEMYYYSNGTEDGAYWPVPGFPAVMVQIKVQKASDKVVLNARPSLQNKNVKKDKLPKGAKKENYIEFKKCMKKADFIFSAENDPNLIFSPLLETNITPRKLNSFGESRVLSITNKPIKILTAMNKGIPQSNVYEIANRLIDLELRLTIAAGVENETVSTELIKISKGKPAVRIFTREEKTKYAPK